MNGERSLGTITHCSVCPHLAVADANPGAQFRVYICQKVHKVIHLTEGIVPPAPGQAWPPPEPGIVPPLWCPLPFVSPPTMQ